MKHLTLIVLAIAVAFFGGMAGRHLLASLDDGNSRVLATLHAHADPPAPAESERPALRNRLVVVVVDGLGADPFEALVDAGELGAAPDWRGYIDVGAPSLSRPSYHQLLTGVSQSVSGIRSNAYAGRARADGLPARVREAGGSVAWALEGVHWFADLFGEPVDTRLFGASTRDLDALVEVYEGGAELIVWHLIRVDIAGHAHGADSDVYRDEAREAFHTIRALRERIAATESDAARTYWMIGADHGHLASGGHGGPESAVRRTCWVGLWPSAPRNLVVLPAYVPATRMAATFARILDIATPREALGEALPLPDHAAVVQPSIAARDAAVHRVFDDEAKRAMRGVAWRSIAVALALAAAVTITARRYGTRTTMEALGIVAAAMAAYALLGPGFTLSAIRTHGYFLARTIGALAVGSALASYFVRVDAPRARITLVASLVPVASALAVLAGSIGRTNADPYVCLLAPTAGLVPAGVACGLAAAATLRRMRGKKAAK